MCNSFDINDYKAQKYIPVTNAPKTAFMIHSSHVEENIYLIYHDTKWHLVHQSVVSERAIPTSSLRTVSLHEGVKIDGQTFIFYVGYAGVEDNGMWEASLRKAVNLAQKGWVNIKSNNQTGYITTPAKPTNQKPSWYNGTFQELLKYAFRGRCIDLDHSLVKQTREDRMYVVEVVED